MRSYIFLISYKFLKSKRYKDLRTGGKMRSGKEYKT